MKGADLIKQLKRKFRVPTDNALAAQLGITIQGVQLWKNRPSVTVKQVTSLVHRASKVGARLSGAELVKQLKKKFNASTDDDLAAQIGITIPGVQLWKGRSSITIRQIVRLAHGASKGGANDLQRKAIRPMARKFPTKSAAMKKPRASFSSTTAS